MTRRWLLAALALSLPSALNAQGERKTSAIFPASVAKGPAVNGVTLTAALRDSFARHGYKVVAADKVDAAVKELKLDLSKQQNTRTLGALRDAVGADVVVYPRLLSIGTALGAEGQQVTVLVNVQGKSNASFLHTRQLSHPFSPKNTDDFVLPRPDFDMAVAKLLEGFYARPK
ncbi:MAG: hypothetical protein ACO1SX_22735 [Actinomycetota bacterium]